MTAKFREAALRAFPLPQLDDLGALEAALAAMQPAAADIVARGVADLETVKRIERLLYVAEYKRRQAPPGVRVSRRAFGRDWRYPITSGYRR